MRGLITRTPECAQHVHVGLPDQETAIRVFNGLRAHLPLLTALAANSPFWFGRDSGLASARWAIVRGYPRHRTPPFFEDYGHYEECVAQASAHGDLPDYTYLWWDVRMHPRIGTVEVREMDAQGDLGCVGALGEAVLILARRAAQEEWKKVATEAIAESSFRAARDGVGATLYSAGKLRPVPEIAREVIGGDAVERLLEAGGAAARRRAAYERLGMRGVLEELATETAL
jgi:carboxylate-amine ligase